MLINVLFFLGIFGVSFALPVEYFHTLITSGVSDNQSSYERLQNGCCEDIACVRDLKKRGQLKEKPALWQDTDQNTEIVATFLKSNASLSLNEENGFEVLYDCLKHLFYEHPDFMMYYSLLKRVAEKRVGESYGYYYVLSQLFHKFSQECDEKIVERMKEEAMKYLTLSVALSLKDVSEEIKDIESMLNNRFIDCNRHLYLEKVLNLLNDATQCQYREEQKDALCKKALEFLRHYKKQAETNSRTQAGFLSSIISLFS
jgi:hypothetical protein